jgi:hypothetical protein
MRKTKLPNGGELHHGFAGDRWWYDKNGVFHREDGPAIITLTFHGNVSFWNKYWWWRGEPVYCKTQEEFERFLKLKAFW